MKQINNVGTVMKQTVLEEAQQFDYPAGRSSIFNCFLESEKSRTNSDAILNVLIFNLFMANTVPV